MNWKWSFVVSPFVWGMRKGLVSLVGAVNKKTGQYFAFHSQSKGVSPPQWAQHNNAPTCDPDVSRLFPPPDSLPVPGPDDDVPAATHLPQDGRPARPHHLPAAAALRGLRPGGRQGAHSGERACRGHPPTPAVAQVAGQATGARLAGVLQQHHVELSCEAASGTLPLTSLVLTHFDTFCAFFPLQRAPVTTERLFLPPQEWQCYLFMCRLHCVFGTWHGFPLSGWFLCGMSLNICVFVLYHRAALLVPAKSSPGEDHTLDPNTAHSCCCCCHAAVMFCIFHLLFLGALFLNNNDWKVH